MFTPRYDRPCTKCKHYDDRWLSCSRVSVTTKSLITGLTTTKIRHDGAYDQRNVSILVSLLSGKCGPQGRFWELAKHD